MELNLSPLADVTRSTSAQSAGRSGTTLADLRSRDSIGGSFESYLKRARSDADAASAEDVEETPDTETRTEEDQPTSEASSSEDTGDDARETSETTQVVVAQPGSVLEVIVSSSEAAASQATELPAEGKAEATGVSSGGRSQATSHTEASQTAATPAADTSAEGVEDGVMRVDASAKTAQQGPVVVEQADRDSKTPVPEQTAKTVVTPVSKENAPAGGKPTENGSTNAPTANAKEGERQVAQPAVKSDADSTGSRQGEARTESQTRDVQTNKSGGQESFFDVKIRESINLQREGSGTGTERTGGISDATGGQASKAHHGSSSTTSHAESGYLSELREKQSSVSEGSSGENGVTSVAKFLLSGLNDAQHAGANDASQGVTARVVGETGGESVTATSGTSAGGGVGQGSAAGTLFTATLTNAEAAEEMAQVLRASSGAGRQQITLQLDPPELGQLRLQVQMRQDAMTLHVEAESQSVARTLESKLSVLKESLAAHGIRVERAEIVVKTPNSAETGQHRQDGEHSHSGDRGHGPAADFGGSSRQGGRATAGQQDAPEGSGYFGDYQAEPSGDVEPTFGTSWTMPDSVLTAELSVDLVA